MKETERLAEEFKAQGRSRIFDNPSGVEFIDKHMRTIKSILDLLWYYPIALLMNIAEELSGSPLIEELSVRFDCESLTTASV